MPFVVELGSKQYTVVPGQKFVVDRMDQYQIDQVLDLPSIYSYGSEAGKKLQLKIVTHQKGKKIRVVKYKAKSNYHRQYGYRHYETILEVLGESGESVKIAKTSLTASTPTTSKSKTSPKASKTTKKVLTVEKAITKPASENSEKNDLTKIEGIGPKINELLNNSGINTFSDLAEASVETLEQILTDGGSHFAQHKPTTWAEQSRLAKDEKWEELKKWQDELMGGQSKE